MGRKDYEKQWLFDRCREVQAEPNGKLDLWAREHYKSTTITYGLTIQEILRDPEVTIGIFSHTRPIAKGFLKQIKREFEANAQLKEIFPDILYANPEREAVKWSEDDGIIVKRKGNPKEATLEAWGLVDGQPTSKHFRLRIYDDVVTRESVTTPEQIKKTTEAWELSINLGCEGGIERYIGTRYHFSDTYAEMLRRGAVIPRIKPATDDGTETGNPVLLSRESLLKKRQAMGAFTFGCQMLQDPKAGQVDGFDPEHIRKHTKEPHQLNWREMNRVLLCDPASAKSKKSDYTAMVVIGLAPDKNYYLLDGCRGRFNLAERTKRYMALHAKWMPRVSAYEEYGQQADIEHIKEVMERENHRFEITSVGGKVAKIDRIKRLSPVFAEGRFWLPVRLPYLDDEKNQKDFVRELIEDEYNQFPVSQHDDMLDCIARVFDVPVGFPVGIAHEYPVVIKKYNALED